MKRNRFCRLGVVGLLHSICVYGWLLALAPLVTTNTYYSVYLMCAMVSLVCLCDILRGEINCSRQKILCFVGFSVLFSAAVLLANYDLFLPMQLDVLTGTFLGGICVALPILLWMYLKLPRESYFVNRNHPVRFFVISFFVITIIDLTYLFFARFPGILTRDSITTIAQIMEVKQYDNVMPFWHTIAVGVLVRLGMFLFSDINAAVALVHCAQILLMAGCFAYVMVTLYQDRVPTIVLLFAFFVYVAMPYNIAYSVTLWKDVPFSASVLLFVTSLHRLMKGNGKKRPWEYVPLVIGILGFSLLRTNGWYAFGATTIALFLVLRHQYKRLLVILVTVLVFSWALINPVLDILGVKKTNFVEAFAVPFQQLGRVVANDQPLTTEEKETLNEVFFLDRMGELYNPLLVDPIKFDTFRFEEQDAIEENIGKYIVLYLRLGVRYPGDYIKAWVDQTKGYWNAGYDYWIYTKGIDPNDFGITEMYGDNWISRGFDRWSEFFEKLDIFQPLVSIGLHAWGLIACTLVNALKKRKEALLGIPVLVLLVGLWLGTPVYAEFRYAYPLFLTMPLIGCVTAFAPEKS